MSVKDKVVIITGASSGMGEATARQLAKDGAKLLLIARHEEILKKIQADFADGQIMTAAVDVTDFEDLKKVVKQAYDQFGHIDVLFNNAGIMPLSPLSAGKRGD